MTILACTVGIRKPNARLAETSEIQTTACSEFEHGHDLNSEQVLGTGRPNSEQILAVPDHLKSEQVLVRISDDPFQVLVRYSDVI